MLSIEKDIKSIYNNTDTLWTILSSFSSNHRGTQRVTARTNSQIGENKNRHSILLDIRLKGESLMWYIRYFSISTKVYWKTPPQLFKEAYLTKILKFLCNKKEHERMAMTQPCSNEKQIWHEMRYIDDQDCLFLNPLTAHLRESPLRTTTGKRDKSRAHAQGKGEEWLDSNCFDHPWTTIQIR